MSTPKRYTEEDYWLPVIFIGIICGIFFAVITWCLVSVFSKPTPLGYGGSDGHLSPNEVEELYEKNKK